MANKYATYGSIAIDNIDTLLAALAPLGHGVSHLPGGSDAIFLGFHFDNVAVTDTFTAVGTLDFGPLGLANGIISFDIYVAGGPSSGTDVYGALYRASALFRWDGTTLTQVGSTDVYASVVNPVTAGLQFTVAGTVVTLELKSATGETWNWSGNGAAYVNGAFA